MVPVLIGIIQASVPESYELYIAWAGLLTYSPRPAFPFLIETVAKMDLVYGAYSCGTVTDLHHIPF